MEPDNQDIDNETGEIMRPLSEVYDAENDLTMYVITPVHSLSDILRFVFANFHYDEVEFQTEVDDVIAQHERLNGPANNVAGLFD